MQKIIAASYYSVFALGGARFHNPDYEGYADTVYLGAFRKESLFKAGLFDEKFLRNQDDELNYRIIKSRGKIYLTPAIKSVYYPRNSLKKLFSQHFQYGEWRVAFIRKHGKPARLTQLIPAFFVFFNITGLLLFFLPLIRCAYGFVMFCYLLLDFRFSFTNTHLTKFFDKLVLCWVHFVLHISYGIGFIKGMIISK